MGGVLVIGINQNYLEFECVPIRCTYNSDNYKVYGANVDLKIYPNVKLNKYENVTLIGDFHDLGIGIKYKVKAEESENKFGYQYKVKNIKREKPTDNHTSRLFLSEILTANQVEILLSAYPDIIDRVINNRLDDIDLNKTKGIKQYIFNVVKNKIIENFALVELVDEFQGLINISMLKKLYEKYPSTLKIRTELKNDPYKCLCGLSRVGFKTADSLLLEVDKTSKENINNGLDPIIDFEYDLKTSFQREKACIMYLLEENENNGNTMMDVVVLKKQSEKLAPACIEHFVDVIKEGKHIFYDKLTKSVALKETYETELYISERITNGLKSNIIWDFDIEKYREVEGVKLTDQQINALGNICKYNISILNGYAGTGKTASTNSIIKMLKANNKSFELFSPTGRAAKVLSGYTNESASTIHRGLAYMPPNEWGYNEINKLWCDVLIVDEFSMVDIFIMKKLLEATDFNRTKLLIIGDSAQIPSVGAGNILYDLCNSNLIPTTTLTQVFRYNSGGLMTVATKTRNCEEFLTEKDNEITFFGDDKGYIFIPSHQDKIVNNTVSLYKKLLEKGYNTEDILVLSSYNKGDYGTVAINSKLQVIANSKINSGVFIKIGDTTYFEDDLVIQNVNNYKAPIYSEERFTDEVTFVPNGEIGKIKEIRTNSCIIDFDGKLICYDKSMMLQLKLAYCISIHKSQGGQIKVVILLTPKAHTYMLNSNLMYVGQTRAKEKCYQLGDIGTINRAIKEKANFERNTFLSSLLLQSNKTNISSDEK
jgi:exodeoxyribonuclease V alpha subunit